VVWEGRSRKTAPYPDRVSLSVAMLRGRACLDCDTLNVLACFTGAPAMKRGLLILVLIAATILASCEGQRLAQCDPTCVPRKEVPSPIQPPWWADPRDR
jgi:hypothetical protein